MNILDSGVRRNDGASIFLNRSYLPHQRSTAAEYVVHPYEINFEIVLHPLCATPLPGIIQFRTASASSSRFISSPIVGILRVIDTSNHKATADEPIEMPNGWIPQ